MCHTPWWPNHPPGAFLLLGHSLYPPPPQACVPLYPSTRPPARRGCLALRNAWLPTCLTRVGIPHHGGQVAALAHVHRHKGCVFADDVAGLAGVHGIHLVAAARPCGGRSWRSLWRLEKSSNRGVRQLKGGLNQGSPSLGFNKPLKLRGGHLAN